MTAVAHTSKRRVSDAIVDALAEAGVEYVLGMPGGYVGNIFKSLSRHPTIRTIQVREESIGSTMAEAYGRLTGKPAVVIGQGEWIVGNAGQGILEALLGSSALVVLTEMTDGGAFSHHAPYQSGTGDYGTWDARGALDAITKRVMVSHAPAQAVQHTQLALKHAVSGAPGPVGVIFHSNSLRGFVGPETRPQLYASGGYLRGTHRSVDEDRLAAASEALARAERPVIVAGNGVRVGQACEALAELAGSLGVPVATTASGKGVFDECHPLAAGVIGNFGQAAANALVGDADLVLAIGTKLGPHDTSEGHPNLIDPCRQTLIQVDVEPLNAAWTLPAEHVLVGDAGHVMGRIRCALTERDGGSGERISGEARVGGVARRHRADDEAASSPDAMPMSPQRLISVLQGVFPVDGIITCDAGENRLFMMQWYRSRRPGGYLQPAAGGGMGYAIPAAMAAKLAFTEQPSLAVCGDGGFAMSLHALLTAVQEDLPIGVLVFNNNALGWVLHGIGEGATKRFGEVDHVGIARALGCDAVGVTSADDLRDALELIPGATRPLVIDVPTSLSTSFKDVTQVIAGVDDSTGY